MTWVRELFSGVSFFQPTEEDLKCELCRRSLLQSEWGIVHGVAYCDCGAGYQCLVRDKEGKLLDQPPVCLVDKALLPKYREAWQSSKSKEEYERKIALINKELGEQ